MELKEGYKQTEVGVIPEDWMVRNLGELLGNPPRYGINAPACDFDQRFPTYIRITDITDDGYFDRSGISSVTHPDADSYLLSVNDLVVARTGASVGKTYRYNPDDGKLVFAGFLVCLSTDEKKLDSRFLASWTHTETYWKWIKENSMRSGQPGVNGKQLQTLPIPLPPTKAEQEAIAEALSDADALITSLEDLIAKKRCIKQGAMQQLLTGKRRLPGFSGDWEPRRLGDLGVTYGGLTGKTKADFGKGSARYVTFLNVISNTVIDCSIFEAVSISPTESQNRVIKGDLLFNGSSETPEEVALCSLLNEEVEGVYLNSFCFGFRFREAVEANGLFIAYFLRSSEGRELMKSLAQGSTRYNLSKAALLDSSIVIPNLPEQRAIATILSEIDQEVASLETKLSKARLLKQGMMQQLLTGSIRLINNQ